MVIRGSYRILRLEGEIAQVCTETWEGGQENLEKFSALRLILRHSRGSSSHSVNVEMLCTSIICEFHFGYENS